MFFAVLDDYFIYTTYSPPNTVIRSHVNPCSEGYGLALRYYIFSSAVSLTQKNTKQKQNPKTQSHCDDPVVTLPQSNCSSPREGAVDQGVGLARWVGTWEDRNF